MSTSIDDLLGPAAGRFFGEGFKRVGQQIRAIEVSGDGVRGRATVTYPTDWSRKASGNPPPHLSTIDALVIAVQLAEIHLIHEHGVAQRRAMWLRSFDMRAGISPLETLDELAVHARRVGGHGTSSTYLCAAGPIRLTCEIEHPMPTRSRATAAFYAVASDVLGHPERRYYGAGFKARGQRLHSLRVAEDAASVQAQIALLDPPHVLDEGFGGAYQPSVSLLDCFVALAQLAQVLAYRIDDIERGHSHTLWMRRLALTADAPQQPMSQPFNGSVSLRRSRLLSLDGADWRSLDVAGGFLGIHGHASMAHRLPIETTRSLAA
jgi:hypothetical protein